MTLELPTFASVMAPTTLNYKDLLRICLSPEAVSCVNTGTRSVIQTLFTLHPDLLYPFCSVPCPHLLASSVQTCNSLGEEFPELLCPQVKGAGSAWEFMSCGRRDLSQPLTGAGEWNPSPLAKEQGNHSAGLDLIVQSP